MSHHRDLLESDEPPRSIASVVGALVGRTATFLGSRSVRQRKRAKRASTEKELHRRRSEIDRLLEELEALYAELADVRLARRCSEQRAELLERAQQTKQQLRNKQLDLLRFESHCTQLSEDGGIQADAMIRRAARRLNSKLVAVRCKAAAELGGLQHPEALRLLAEAKDDRDERVRVAVLDALASRGGPVAVSIISQFVDDTNQQIRLAALRGLAALAPETSRRRLLSALGGR